MHHWLGYYMAVVLETACVKHLASLVAQMRVTLPSQVSAFLVPETML